MWWIVARSFGLDWIGLVEFFFTALAERFVSRLTREFLFPVVGEPNHKKNPKNLAPTSALRCASGPLLPALLQGPA
jgi:hypothetical protein